MSHLPAGLNMEYVWKSNRLEQDLRDILKCSHCKDALESETRQCVQGHLICKWCIELPYSGNVCRACRSPYLTNSEPIEKVIDAVLIARGIKPKLSLEAEAEIKSIPVMKQVVRLPYVWDRRTSWELHIFDKLFRFVFYIDRMEDALFGAVICEDDSAEQFRFEITLLSPERGPDYISSGKPIFSSHALWMLGYVPKSVNFSSQKLRHSVKAWPNCDTDKYIELKIAIIDMRH